MNRIHEIRVPGDAATLTEAKALVRGLLHNTETDAAPDEIVVTLAGGVYSPTEFVFGEEDCSKEIRVTYRTEENAVVHGGITVEKALWQMPDAAMAERFSAEARPQIRMISLSALGLTRGDWGEEVAIGAYETSSKYDDAPRGCGCEFFTGDRRMVKARYPNAGAFAQLEAVADVGDVREFPPQNYYLDWDKRRNHRGGAYIIDRAMAKRAEGWREPDKAWMFGYFYWDWADSSTPVTFRLENRVVYPKFVSGFAAQAGAHYYFYNVPEELDSEGECYLDRDTGNLYFWPWDGAETADFSCRDIPLILCENTCNMTFSGFTILGSMGNAVVSTGEDMEFSGLLVKNVYGHAIVVNGSRNVCVTAKSCIPARAAFRYPAVTVRR